jgi:hypothetical protein
MKEDFDHKFQELFTRCVEISFELVEYDKEVIKEIYIYASMEKGMFFFNVFFETSEGLSYIHELNGFSLREFDLSDDRVFEFLDKGNELLSLIFNLFLTFNREVPTLIKMMFKTKDNSFDSKLIYDLQYTNDLQKTAADCFDEWFEKIKKEKVFQ